MEGVAESKYGDPLEVNNIKLKNNSTNNIYNKINYYNNMYSKIPTQYNNQGKINSILRKIKTAESDKNMAERNMREYGGVSFSRNVNSKWQRKIRSYNTTLKFLREDLARAQSHKNTHNKSRRNITIKQKQLEEYLRALQPKDNEIRRGGKHRKTHKRHHYKRHTHKHRPNKHNKTKRNHN